MELLGLATIIAYTLSTFSMKYVLVEEEHLSFKKTYFDILFFFSLVLFSAYTYNLVDNLYQKFNFITSLEITFLIVNYLFFAFMFSKPIKHLGLVLLPLTLITIPFSMLYHDDGNIYILSRAIVKKGKWFGEKICKKVIERPMNYEIDDEVDWHILEELIDL